jgi:hypothetical protein
MSNFNFLGFADIPIQDAIQYIISNEPRQQLTVNNTLGAFRNTVLTPQNGISPIIQQQQSRPTQVDISSLQGISPTIPPTTRDQYSTSILSTQQQTQDLQSESTVQSNNSQDLQSLLVTLLGSLQQENQGNIVSQQTQQTSMQQQYIPEQGIQNTHQSLLQGQSSTTTTQQQTQQTNEIVPQNLINLLNTLSQSFDQQSAPQGNQQPSVQNSSDPNQYNPQQYQYT